MEQLLDEVREMLSHPIATRGITALGGERKFSRKAEQIALKYYVPVEMVLDIYNQQVKEEWKEQGWEN